MRPTGNSSGTKAAGDAAVVLQVDLSTVTEVDKLFGETVTATGRPDVNSTGMLINKPILDNSEADYSLRDQLQDGVFLC